MNEIKAFQDLSTFNTELDRLHVVLNHERISSSIVSIAFAMMRHARNTFITTMENGIMAKTTKDFLDMVDYYSSQVNDDGDFVPGASFNAELRYMEALILNFVLFLSKF